MKLFQGFKIRIYPSDAQILKMHQFAVARIKAYNWGLEQQYSRLNSENKLKLLNRKELTAQFVDLTKTDKMYYWIRELGVSRHLFYYAFDDLNNTVHDYLTHQRAFKNKRAGKPKYKSSKFTKWSFSQRNDMKLICRNKIQIAKLGLVPANAEQLNRVGDIYKPAQLASIRFSFDGINYWVSFNKRIIHPDSVKTGESIGVDLGRKVWATCSDGSTLIFPTERLAKYYHKLVLINRRIQLASNGSVDSQKLYLKRRVCLARIKNITDDCIKQYVAKVVQRRPRRVVMENLAVSGMSHSNWFHQDFKDSKFRYFRDQMQYRCERMGIEFVLADRYYPSSQICSKCHSRKKMPISNRTYQCEHCGLVIDRDLNAAINLANY